MPDQELKTARHLLSRAVGVVEFYSGMYAENAFVAKLVKEINEFLWPEEIQTSPTLDSRLSAETGAEGGEPCGSTEGRADEHKTEGQGENEGRANRVNDSVMPVRESGVDCDLRKASSSRIRNTTSYSCRQVGTQAPPAGEVSAPIRITDDNTERNK